MEDIASGFSKPCIADIKIGRQTWVWYPSFMCAVYLFLLDML